jgi:outer membrane protein assembly factor BamB
VTVPVVVDVVWAGDTPMIQVTEMSIPMLGTYSARVVIFGDQYAGLWSGSDHGGHMFGTIEPAAKKTVDARQSTPIEWPSWRGPAGTGAVAGANPPAEWSEDKNIRWKVRLPGNGSSTPIVWRDRIFLTTAVQTDEPGTPPDLPELANRRGGGERPDNNREGERGGGEEGRRGGRGNRGGRGGRGGGGMNRDAPKTFFTFHVLALDRDDGSVVWNSTVKRAVPHEGGHPTGSQASNSPLTDGEHIYTHFGSRGIHCHDMDGEEKWSQDFGYMRTRNQFGEGSSPALHGDRLVVNWDHEADSFVVVLDKRTGEELWRKERDEITSWSTPIITTVDDRPQVIITATNASRAYDLESGDLVWSCGGMTTNAIPSPMNRDGIAYLMSGFRGAMLQAVRLAGASGDITDSDNILWTHRRSTSYVPSALLYDDYMYFMRSNSGVLTCLDARTGQPHYEGQRLEGIREVYASPVGAAGRVYITSRSGTTKVIKLGAEFEELATNELGDGFDASAVIVGDVIYLRGQRYLYCIGEKREK